MTDELDDLRRAIKSATPAPDAARKAAIVAMAQKNFETFQGSPDVARPNLEARKKLGLFQGVIDMFFNLPVRGALVGTTALVAIGFVALVPMLQQSPDLNLPKVGAESAALQDMAVDESMAMDAPMAAAPMGRSKSAPQVVGLSAEKRIQAPSAYAPVPHIEQKNEAEIFASEDANGVKTVAEHPVSTFSIDVDTASYSVIRSSLNAGRLPPKEAVRVEEMINYFPYDYAVPQTGAFGTSLALMQTPWNDGTQILRIALQGAVPETDKRPPLNLVFLIDTSGSMNQPNKLPLLKQSFRLMLGQLRPADQVALVAYAGSAGQVLAPTPAQDRSTIMAAFDHLSAGGSTNGQAGLQQAYAVAAQMHEDGEVSRVVLATDGDFNVGISNPDSLKAFVADKKESGTYLSVLGFGRGNLNDATMQALAQNGNGQAAYIDSLPEAQKVLVDQLSGALFPIADDVKIQVEFNPAAVAEYRLIGYETRALRREDFNNDAVDAGEIGAGHQVTALYEITPVGSDARLSDPLRYGAPEVETPAAEIGYLKLRHKAPGANESVLTEMPITADIGSDPELKFAASIAGFGELLRGSKYLQDWTYRDAVSLAAGARGSDEFGYRAQAVQLMRLAQSLSN